jgi:PAS domain S-box-containing protein
MTKSNKSSLSKKEIDELRESEQRYRMLFENSNDILVQIDKKGNIIDVNKKALEVGGYEKDDLVGKRISALASIFTKTSIAKMVANFAKRMLGVKVKSYVVEGKTKDGTEKFFEIDAVTLKDPSGEKIGELAILHDITKMKESESTLKDSEERLKILFEFAPDGIFLYDTKGNLLDGNRASEELVGRKREDLIGKNLLEIGILPAKQIPSAAKLIAQNTIGKPTGPVEFTLIRKDGSRVEIEIRAYPVKIQNKRVVLGIARDISARKKMEKILKEKVDELEKINKSMVGRELKMIEMKSELKKLKENKQE